MQCEHLIYVSHLLSVIMPYSMPESFPTSANQDPHPCVMDARAQEVSSSSSPGIPCSTDVRSDLQNPAALARAGSMRRLDQVLPRVQIHKKELKRTLMFVCLLSN